QDMVYFERQRRKMMRHQTVFAPIASALPNQLDQNFIHLHGLDDWRRSAAHSAPLPEGGRSTYQRPANRLTHPALRWSNRPLGSLPVIHASAAGPPPRGETEAAPVPLKALNHRF